MTTQTDIQYVSDAQGKPTSVIVSIELWREIKYGKQIVAAGTAYIHASDAHVALFHCDYAQHGWISPDQATTRVGTVDAPTVADELLILRRTNG